MLGLKGLSSSNRAMYTCTCLFSPRTHAHSDIHNAPISCTILVITGFLSLLSFFRSSEWNKVSKKERDKLGITVENDGEFWLDIQI